MSTSRCSTARAGAWSIRPPPQMQHAQVLVHLQELACALNRKRYFQAVQKYVRGGAVDALNGSLSLLSVSRVIFVLSAQTCTLLSHVHICNAT